MSDLDPTMPPLLAPQSDDTSTLVLDCLSGVSRGRRELLSATIVRIGTSTDAETARAKADEYTALVEPDANPRKMEPVHQILGMTEFYQGNYAAAAEELAQAAPGNVYAKYYRAVALDESSQTEEADALFDELAVWNFNGLGYALIRADVLERVAP